MKAELPEGAGTESNPSTTPPSPDSSSIAEPPASAEGSNGSGDETLVQPSSISGSSKGKKKADSIVPIGDKSAAKEPTAENLIGKINNLVTTDLNNITEARDFLFLGECTTLFAIQRLCSDDVGKVLYVPLQVALCVWFLYSILGWSAFVGLSSMVLLFPIPGYVAKMIQGVQITRMKMVCTCILYWLGLRLSNLH